MCCSNPLKTCCSLFTSLISVGFFILFYWAVFQPHQIRATVDSATLANLTMSNATISYRLAVTLSLYNPSRRVDIYYDALDAELRFRGASLGPAAANGTSTSPTEFYQRRKTGDTVRVEFDGTSGAGVPVDVAGALEKEMGAGAVSLEVAVDAMVRYRFDKIKIRQKPKVRCSMTIPVKPEGRGVSVGGVLASGDRCSVDY